MLLSVVGISASFSLMAGSLVTEWPFVVLVSLSAVLGLVVAFSERLQSVSLKDLEIKLAEVESSREEVKHREQEVRRIATAVAEITVFIAVFHRRLVEDEQRELEIQWLTQRVNALLDGMRSSDTERGRVFQYLAAVKKIDPLYESDKTAFAAAWKSLWKKIEEDIRAMKIPTV